MIKKYLKHLVATAENNYLSNLYQSVKNLKVKRMLDVGCYTGVGTIEIAKMCKAKVIWGIELDEKSIEVAKKKAINIVKQDVAKKVWDNESLKEDKFDFVFSNQVIEHLDSVDNFIVNIKRILKKDGLLLLSTENLAGWHNCFALFLGYQPFSMTNICTKKWSIGNPLSIITEGHHDHLMVHRSVFTYLALKQFLGLYDSN